MKNILRSMMFILPLTLTLGLTIMAQAVTDTSRAVTTAHSSNYHDNEDHSSWGLLGLVGLIGLAGLAKRGPVERKVEYRDNQVR